MTQSRKHSFFAKIALLCAGILVAHIGFRFFSGPFDTPSTIALCDRHLDERRGVIYFGDSTIYRGHPHDADTSTTAALLQALLPTQRVGGIYHDAYNLSVYRDFTRYISHKNFHPTFLVIPINLRSLSAEQRFRPEYQFVRESLFLANDNAWFRTFYRPLATFKVFALRPISRRSYYEAELFDGERSLGATQEVIAAYQREQQGEALKNFVLASYLYPLNDDHPHLVAMIEIMELCKQMGTTPIFYVTPFDVELGSEIVGPDFRRRIEQNVAVIAEIAGKRSAVFLDLATQFPHELFAEQRYPESYLRDVGKRRLAQSLATVILDAR